ncbi:estradiol 17-beta-dehydrogenase 11-like [Culicoides brevitarsis]|uniref:estradiol 17-beta-dehydrogenase 11-like n=1 Tax=Culicoides brevitarsis TaxID=469753 RepID=UPI00307B856D
MVFFTVIFGTILFVMLLTKLLQPKPKSLLGQVVLITGGANGLGKQLSKRFAKLGCKIAIADLDIENAKKTVEELKAYGCTGGAFAYKTDVSSLSDIENLRTCIERDLGPVDMVVNNAAILYCKSIEEENPKVLQKLMDVNTMSLFWTTRVFLPGMKERKRGHIVAVSSATALLGAPKLHAYTASKFAVRGFMEALKVDLSVEGHSDYIHQTTAYPWWIETREYVNQFTEQVFKYCFKLKPEYVAKMIVEGVMRNERDVTIPGALFYLGYLINVSYLTSLYMKFMGVNTKEELINKKRQQHDQHCSKKFLLPAIAAIHQQQ